jgi:hypothetical protein
MIWGDGQGCLLFRLLPCGIWNMGVCSEIYHRCNDRRDFDVERVQLRIVLLIIVTLTRGKTRRASRMILLDRIIWLLCMSILDQVYSVE